MSMKTRVVLVLLIGTALGLGLPLAGNLMHASEHAVEIVPPESADAQQFAEVLELVKQDYVEPLDDDKLLDNAIRGMVNNLDPHSEYLDANDYRDIRISTSGSYTGIGIEIDENGGVVRIITPISGTPAARSGIRSGDQLLAIDGTAVDSDNLKDTINLLRGQPGSKVKITVKRDDKAIDYEMRRQIIRVASVHHELLAPSFGYVRISQFSDTTARELGRAIDSMRDENGGGLDGLILDLRNNPGGVLDAAVDVADLFLDSGVIVSANGRTPDANFTRSAHRGDILDGAAMVVLVNKGSASASEIVTGALQDLKRATVIGTSTYGKGLVQTVVPLSKGRAIKLTTSRYYTPSGNSIQDIGITPDVYVQDTAGYPDLSLTEGVDREGDSQLHEAIERLGRHAIMHSNAVNVSK